MRAELGIWLILAGSGLASALLAQFGPTVLVAPWTYALPPIAIGLFNWRFSRAEARQQLEGA